MRRFLPFAFAALGCLLLWPASAPAQSGRKQKKADPLPPVQGVNQPEARTVPEAEVAPEDSGKAKEQERTIFEIMSQMPDLGMPTFYADTARKAFFQELRRQVQSINVTDGGSNKNRKDAMDAAKGHDKLYAVLLELNTDQFGTSQYGFDLRYAVFEPKTGKQVAFGSGYPTQPNSIPQPPIGMSRAEMYIEWAARDAANQVIGRLKLRGSY